jgi:hypothetical protein
MLAEIVAESLPAVWCRQMEANGPSWVAINRWAKGTSIWPKAAFNSRVTFS